MGAVRLMPTLALAASLTAAAACHRAPDVAVPGSAMNVITRDELDSAGAVSIYDVIVRRHALFLRDRGPTSINSKSAPRAVVFLAEQEYGPIETLRNLPAERFESVRYYSGTEAAARFGSQYNGGVIQLVPRYR
jgi:hypothetical protein